MNCRSKINRGRGTITDMTKARARVLNSSLPASFRQIRLELAREPGHPVGDAGIAYVIVAPLDLDNRIDPDLWKRHREACRVARFRPGKDDDLGHLVHRTGGAWAFQYDISSNSADDVGYHFSDEHFVPGEYVSISEDGKMHTFRVVSTIHL